MRIDNSRRRNDIGGKTNEVFLDPNKSFETKRFLQNILEIFEAPIEKNIFAKKWGKSLAPFLGRPVSNLIIYI